MQNGENSVEMRYLTLDLVDGDLTVFNVRNIGGGDPTRIGGNGGAVWGDTDGGDGGENDSVDDPRGREKAEPAVNEDEDGGEVNVGDGQNDDAHWEREHEATVVVVVLRFLGHGGAGVSRNDGV